MKLIDTERLKKIDKIFFIISLVFMAVSFTATLLMYLEVTDSNVPVYFTYPLSMVMLVLSCRRFMSFDFKGILKHKQILVSVIGLSTVYLLVHLGKISTAPWNSNGLFDDAAWDIFDARLKCFADDRFEMIFFDSNIGGISRELVFHYYITIFFRLFGYNLQVFNAALMFLGWITLMFTMLSVKELTDNIYISVCSALTLMFLPLEFTQVYMGHRYAICGPLLMISFYFVVRACKRKSMLCGAIGGIFAGLTMSSAIMGKQYIWGLLIVGGLYAVYYLIKDRNSLKDHLPACLMGTAGYFAAAAPLYAYILTHRVQYNIRQDSIMKDFFEQVSERGLEPVIENLKVLAEVLFGESTGQRQFSQDYPVFPWFYLVFFVLGILFLLAKKKFCTIVFALIPIAGCVVSLAYDFRILISAPFISFIIVSGVFGLAEIISRITKIKENYSYIGAVVLSAVMLIPQTAYISGLADDPHSQRHLAHHSVAVSRYMQDLALGKDDPDVTMKKDEFNLGNTNSKYDIFIAVQGTYGHIHAFLGEESSRHILQLCGDFPYISQSEDDIRRNVYGTIQSYKVKKKDLMLAFEYSDQVEDIIGELEETGLCKVSYDTKQIEGLDVNVCTVYVLNKDIEQFKELTSVRLTAE